MRLTDFFAVINRSMHSLAQVYAALAYYHANHAEVESELAAADIAYDKLRRQDTPENDAS